MRSVGRVGFSLTPGTRARAHCQLCLLQPVVCVVERMLLMGTRMRAACIRTGKCSRSLCIPSPTQHNWGFDVHKTEDEEANRCCASLLPVCACYFCLLAAG